MFQQNQQVFYVNIFLVNILQQNILNINQQLSIQIIKQRDYGKLIEKYLRNAQELKRRMAQADQFYHKLSNLQLFCRYYLYKFKIRRIQMRNFATPPKQPSDRSYSSTTLREGDWMCFNCRNLNFSFRKKCNRCKTQTKEQNDQLIPYYYSAQFGFYSDSLQQITNYATNSIYFDKSQPKKYPDSFSHAGESTRDNLQGNRHKQSYSLSQDEQVYEKLSFSCQNLNWNQYLNVDEGDFSSSDESRENSQEEDLLNEQIEQMVTRIII